MKKGAVEAMAAGIIAVLLILTIGYFLVRTYPGEFKSGKEFSQWAKNAFDLVTGKKAQEERLRSEANFLEAFSRVYNGLNSCVGESGDSCYCDLRILDYGDGFLIDFEERFVVTAGRKDANSFYLMPSEFGEEVEGERKTYLIDKATVLVASSLCVYLGEGKVQDVEGFMLYRDDGKLVFESGEEKFSLNGPLRVVRFRGFEKKACFVHPDAMHDRFLPANACKKGLNIEKEEGAS